MVGKPDLHVLPTIAAVLGKRCLSPEECIRELIVAAQREAPVVRATTGYGWLDGGLFPRDIDRVIYLIGSDNFRLDGVRRKRSAPARRQLMVAALSGRRTMALPPWPFESRRSS